ncbi:uncharacterized protein STEHIDRAFT_84394 [Stereum hirsutum FP-91666 SS1]|uniref:uncharacterized protein n=1 Tax=Stereum hirsutum (strain FP-91666) TaxID=721885 RepID=UPI0004449CF5|nr:uncharacterized protein STEHIDRAFT_84394 [Stereum hirsutum FP-91666 SS1]EIM83003.1 hypothetical protein STEHIDRAFT_84394 [Stereum hirsutum FP-91666 SS1]
MSTTGTVRNDRDGLPWFSESFFSRHPAMKKTRAIYFKILLMASMLIILIILGFLSIYWGALWKTFAAVHKLEGWIIDFDGGEVGQYVSQALAATSGPPDTMTWTVKSASDFSNDTESLIDLVVNEHTWALVSINAGASDKLDAAVAAADSSYNGSLAVTIYVEEARNENSYAEMLHPIVTGLMDSIVQQHTAQFTQQLGGSSNNLSNLLSTAPNVVSNPASYTIYNTRPFDVAVATAVDFVGLIYLLIISFVISLQNFGAREATGISHRLNMTSLILLRLLVPIIMYFYLSAFFALLSLAFQVPFSRVFGASGFVIYWMLAWLGMCALGLAVEAFITLLTARFIAVFLILWIISNVSVSFFPLDLLPGVFKYGYATPFYNVSCGVRTIIFNTKNRLGLNFGVLIAWVAVSCITITLFTYIIQRRNIRQREEIWRKEDAQREKEVVDEEVYPTAM